jgi:hypothetical protein
MSKLWTVSTQQWIKGLFIFVVPTVITVALEALKGGNTIDLLAIGKVALIAALTYILYSFGQDSTGKVLGSADKTNA